jgi:adenylate cyclase
MINSILTQAIERNRDDLISQIITVINDVYAKNIHDQFSPADHRQLLRPRLVDLINRTLDKETATKSREVTIMLSDLRGFTAMSENYPAYSVIEMLNRYLSKMCEIIITQHTGVIDKFMGDSIMVLFTGQENRSDMVERALSCAVHMQISMDEINRRNESTGMPPLYMGIGINTGNVVTGAVGSKLHSEYTVIGDEVNLASRIESYSLRGQILISENTYQHAKDYIETDKPIRALVKGKRYPINLYELLSVNRPSPLTVPRREIRKSPRIDVDMPFTYQRVVDKKILPEKYEGRILDISYNGLLGSLAEPLEVFSEIRFPLSLSMLGGQTSDVYAKILKIRDVKGECQAHIEFTSIQIHAKDAIKSFIDRIIQGV